MTDFLGFIPNMAKRLTNTDKWKTAFFRGLPSEYKLLWIYIQDDCDFAGIWMVDFEVASIRIGSKVNANEAAEFFRHQIEILPGDAWFIPDFIDTNYGVLSPKNNIHARVRDTLVKRNVSTLETVCNHTVPTVKEEYKEQDKEEVKKNKKEPQLEICIWPSFDDFWDLYDKKIDRKLCDPIWIKLTQGEREAIMAHLPAYKVAQPDRKFRKDPVRYLKNKSWTNEIYDNEHQQSTGKGTRHEPFTPEVSNAIQHKFASVGNARRRDAANKPGVKPVDDEGRDRGADYHDTGT